MPITLEMSEVIELAVSNGLADVHTSIPGKVQAYDKTKKTADIEVQLNTLGEQDGSVVSEAVGVLKNVRVGFRYSSGFVCKLPLSPGDEGMLFFTESHMGQWRATGKVSDPDELGRHTMSSPIFEPRALTDKLCETMGDLEDGAVFGKVGGAQLRVHDNTVEATSDGAASANDFVATAETIDKFITVVDATLTAADSILMGAYATQKLIAFPTGVIPSVASKNLKADKGEIL